VKSICCQNFSYLFVIQKAPKAPRPQSFNYAPQVVEKKKPAYAAPTPAPVQYYDYEEEIPTTQRPVQLARPKYAVPQQQFAPQRQQQFGSGGIVYAPEARAPAPQFQQFENRQPLQFPSENASPAPQSNSRPEEFSLFKPASQRSDTFQSKVSPQISERAFKLRKLLNRKLKKWKVFKRKLKLIKGKILRRLKRNKKIYFIVKKKRSYFT
jgi:hypothetical protein